MAGRRLVLQSGLLLLAASLTSGGTIAGEDVGAKDRAIEARLKEPLRLRFKNAPLREVLAHVERATADAGRPGIPIIIDPRSAGAVAATRVSVETEDGEPLGEALSYLLGAHKLRGRVREGRLLIVPSMGYLLDGRKAHKALLARLETPIDLKLQKVPLEDAVRAIQAATRGSQPKWIPFYIDPVGLMEAEVSRTTPVSIDVKRVPVKTVLRDLLTPLGLGVVVKDGLVTITDASNTLDELPANAPGKPEPGKAQPAR